jgi:hypothetical protein
MGLNSGWVATDKGVMDLNDGLLVAGAFMLALILYIMRRRVRMGKKKGTF